MKTVAGCTGVLPPSLGGEIPADWADIDRSGKRFLAMGENFTSAIPKTILPKLEFFIAPDMLSKPPKRGTGTKLPEIFYFKSGAQLHIMSYDQDPASFEGAVWDGVWADEPPPESIFTAVRRGTMARRGWILITATPIKEPWMFDALVAPGAMSHGSRATGRSSAADTRHARSSSAARRSGPRPSIRRTFSSS